MLKGDLRSFLNVSCKTMMKGKESLNPDRITLTLQIEYGNVNDSVGTKKGENDSVGTKDGTKDGTKLSENEAAVYDCLKLNTEITTKAVSVDLGISLRTVQRCLNVLKAKGFIMREGSKTTGKWLILK